MSEIDFSGTWFEHATDPTREIRRPPETPREAVAVLVYRAVVAEDRSRSAAFAVADQILATLNALPGQPGSTPKGGTGE